MNYKPNDIFFPWLPFYSLLKREVLRFTSIATQTVITPIVTASLYLFVFGVHLGGQLSILEGFSYIQFVVPGLILMGVVTNAFANTSSSLFFYRYLGSVVELLVTPIGAFRFSLAFTLAAMLRGITVGVVIWLISMLFTDLPWANPVMSFMFIFLTSFLFAQFGLIAAILSNTFDALAMYTNFLIVPLIYLGGMFYPISMLPSAWQTISRFNPIFYMMDGFRQSVLGEGDIPIRLSLAIAAALALAAWVIASYMIWKGKRLRL